MKTTIEYRAEYDTARAAALAALDALNADTNAADKYDTAADAVKALDKAATALRLSERADTAAADMPAFFCWYLHDGGNIDGYKLTHDTAADVYTADTIKRRASFARLDALTKRKLAASGNWQAALKATLYACLVAKAIPAADKGNAAAVSTAVKLANIPADLRTAYGSKLVSENKAIFGTFAAPRVSNNALVAMLNTTAAAVFGEHIKVVFDGKSARAFFDGVTAYKVNRAKVSAPTFAALTYANAENMFFDLAAARYNKYAIIIDGKARKGASIDDKPVKVDTAPAADKPADKSKSKSKSDKPAPVKSKAAKKPAADKPADKPAADKPADKPAADTPAA